jgi:HD superfamily phosphohydrolase
MRVERQDEDPRALGRIVRDPVHDYVYIPSEVDQLLDHPFMQRLRKISQTSMCSTVYPSMNGMRFEHALGSMHLAGQAWDRMWANSAKNQAAFLSEVQKSMRTRQSDHGDVDQTTTDWLDLTGLASRTRFVELMGLALRVVALIHDVGHPPFSHALEEIYEEFITSILAETSSEFRITWSDLNEDFNELAFHERVGLSLLDSMHDDEAFNKLPYALIREISMGGAGWATALHDLVSSEVDVDRMDYLVRDAGRSGTEFGALDIQRLIDSIELHRVDGVWLVGYGVRSTSAVETFLLQRLQYYRWVVFHPHAIASNRMLVSAIRRTFTHHGTILGRREITLRNLNYFGFDVEDDRREIYLKSEVEDHSIITLLKLARGEIAAKRAAGSHLAPNEIRLEALVLSVIHRKPNWTSVWKSQQDYDDISKRVAFETEAKLKDLDGALLAQQNRRPANKSIDLDSIRNRSQLKLIQSRLEDLWNTDASDLALNFLMTELLQPKESMPRSLCEQIFSERLTSAAASVESNRLPEGEWFVAFERVSLSDNELSDVKIFDGDELVSIKSLSALVTTLPLIEAKRPAFHVYFISLDGRQMREGRTSYHSPELRRVFCQAFPIAVKESFIVLARP